MASSSSSTAGFSVEVVDPVGAGDAFVAGALAGIFQRGSMLDFLELPAERTRRSPSRAALELGNACGALVCTRHGDTEAMPDMAQVRDFIAREDRAGMRGEIRWYSEELEGGSLLGEDGAERSVDSEDLIDEIPPRSGDVVEFEHRDTSDGPRAVAVRIISRSERSDHPGPAQVTCGACRQMMVPRYVPDSVYPSLGHFACVYCGSIFMRQSSSPYVSEFE